MCWEPTQPYRDSCVIRYAVRNAASAFTAVGVGPTDKPSLCLMSCVLLALYRIIQGLVRKSVGSERGEWMCLVTMTLDCRGCWACHDLLTTNPRTGVDRMHG